ncbi:MAG: hypothetical protein WAK17_15450 [Candidatus Nitrosopolaris sp.]|jgi:malic enzyme
MITLLVHYFALITQDKEEIVRLIKAIEPCFGAINIEDIATPKVFDMIRLVAIR